MAIPIDEFRQATETKCGQARLIELYIDEHLRQGYLVFAIDSDPLNCFLRDDEVMKMVVTRYKIAGWHLDLVPTTHYLCLLEPLDDNKNTQ